MPTYEITGETPASLMPGRVEKVTFHGVEVLRVLGTEDEIRESTETLETLYPECEMRTLGAAQFLFYERRGSYRVEIYELIVLRKVIVK